MKKKSDNAEKDAGKWLCTFNDLITLLLTFFVLLLSFSKLNVAKVKAASYSVCNALGMMESGDRSDISIFEPFIIPEKYHRPHKKKSKGEVANQISGISSMDTQIKEEGVLVTLRENSLFKNELADINEEARSSLNKLCAVLKENRCQIRVEGHTDDVPIHGRKYASNWDLSIARAVNVVKYFISDGGIAPERLSAAGYAGTKPLVPNIDEYSRVLNRRVDVVLLLNN